MDILSIVTYFPILQSAGIGCESSQYATLGVGAIMVTMTVVSIPLMDKLGRRTLHLVGFSFFKNDFFFQMSFLQIGIVGMIICSLLITITLNVADLNDAVKCLSTTLNETVTANSNGDVAPNPGGIFAVIATLTFVVFFALGPGSIPWLITGELFTQAPRSAAISVATLVNWTGNLAVGLIFPQLQERITNFLFLPFTIILVILLVILYCYLPETKGIAVNEIEALFQVSDA